MSRLDDFSRACRSVTLAGLILSSCSIATAEEGRPAASRRHWRTWVLVSRDQYRLPPPPTASATAVEAGELDALAATRTPALLARVAWWNAAAPSYRWSQIALEEMLRSGLNANVASRHLALLHTTLADAMVATWDSKTAYERPRPATYGAAIATPASASYPDEHAAAGAAAAAVLGVVFPERAADFARMAEEAAEMRLVAGVAYPSDVAAGGALGRQVGRRGLGAGAGQRLRPTLDPGQVPAETRLLERDEPGDAPGGELEAVAPGFPRRVPTRTATRTRTRPNARRR